MDFLTLTSTLFLILFFFLLSIFIIFVASLFKKESFKPFEPFVSVIIPAYNEEKNIKSCLDSVWNSGYPESKLEIIVVDDGSTDKTRDIAKACGAKVLLQSHKGKTEALNLGTQSAKHPFVLTLDADTTLEKKCINLLVKPLSDSSVGATTGSSAVSNKKGMLTIFQNIEYHYNNLIRHGFSRVFGTGVWFFGALAIYRKDLLLKLGLFKKDTLTEDMDISLEINGSGFRIVNVSQALCSTKVPETFKELYKQRARWWMGVLQALQKNRAILKKKASFPIIFLYVNQYWWSLYSFLSLPVIWYQVQYWLPYNQESFSQTFWYLFRWFTISGPFYSFYKIPEWGFTYNNAFGVLSGIISLVMMVYAIFFFKDKLSFKNSLAVFFYFPYTIALNTIIASSLLVFAFTKKRYFIR